MYFCACARAKTIIKMDYNFNEGRFITNVDELLVKF